ncbi:MAG TPA: RNA polymerase sigma-70 factor [Jiangellaceae bacterium]|nr:RNA polymerase sigma-70 factor [Jiangellaceae bacterium]
MSDPFDEHRRLLFAVAYDMLGSVADAEDVVQDAWLRWSAHDRSDVTEPKAYLVKIVTRLSYDRYRTEKVRRETYVGPWLPEPMLSGGDVVEDVAEDVEQAEEVSMAMLVVLETLTPAERAVFVLREVFGFPYAEIATALDRTEASVRQTAHRARNHVRARRPRFETDPAEQRRVTERFQAACFGGDLGALMELLAPDVVLVADGGGKAATARRPIEGADKVARFVLGLAEKFGRGLQFEFAQISGSPGMIGRVGDQIEIAGTIEVADGKVAQVLIFRNPDKLAALFTA